MPHLDYDNYYDTKISRSYGASKFGLTSAIVIFIIGNKNLTNAPGSFESFLNFFHFVLYLFKGLLKLH